MRRRDMLSGLGLSSLGACTSMPVPSLKTYQPGRTYPPVQSSMQRVTRTVVGLRPYRPQGYRLEAEALGGKTIIHNYGHGGCGVTMSWGTSPVAAELAAHAAEGGPIAVLGAGVMGLTTALILARRGHAVTVYAEHLPPHTTSNIAGVLWFPTGYFDRNVATPDFLRRNHLLIRAAHRGFLPYVNRPGYGVYWADHHALSRRTPVAYDSLPGGDDIYPELQRAHENTLFGYAFMERFRAMIIDPDFYLDEIMQDAQIAGAHFIGTRLSGLSDVEALPEPVIVNCTGLGARDLFGDESLVPIRGQLSHLLPQPEIDYSYVAPTAEGVLYMFPRKTGIVLGGTHEMGETAMEPDPAQIKRMVEGHAELANRLSASS
ncbi:FAD-dependent oxidoreductase [Henriciella mobilis]|uniref:D-amino-acid oxidase n=1 Tax=Henriciella mobilis TaxID=2305467 RepID=A0A399RRH4_9PROT|nr:FAD-dependent oxidoreductase [Henriciella mobilis]RIJ32619.1 FAD-binding oxidoreductase [Henriciella mobilis]